MRKMLEEKLARFQEIERLISDPAILADSSRMAALLREHGGLMKIATRFRRFLVLNEEIADLKKMLASHDPEERGMAEAEMPVVKGKPVMIRVENF